ncbi:thiamine pyrophosphate-dependent enzyme [Burkholderia sp. RS01]|uniref:thiamine pyrophosphate-binding protein n=1 Tax=unclassified Burkholderia TaxID=2613784 RepID=UPI003218111B
MNEVETVSATNDVAKRNAEWGSDAVVDFLEATGIPWIALNPGASFRGLHDSLVNYAGDDAPGILVCLHEEHAVAIAHGWSKITGTPMAVALHSNVGLMHASMAIYNAWCDRAPMLIIGATGPLDAAARRPWIDWIHTSADQPAIVRNFVKWDDTPTSVPATLESLARAWDFTRTSPKAPTYVVMDAAVQEERLTDAVRMPSVSRGPSVDQPSASRQSLDRAAALLSTAKHPVILAGPGKRDEASWQRRIQLAEALGARVITDLKAGTMFPMTHPAHVDGPGFFLSSQGKDVLQNADLVLDLNWIDLAGTLKQAEVQDVPVVSATLDPLLANGWSKDHQARPETTVWLPADPDDAVESLLDRLPAGKALDRRSQTLNLPATDAEAITLSILASALQLNLAGSNPTFARLPLGWDGDSWAFDHPLSYLGYDGGGGIGSGPGMSVGAALALKETDRLAVSVLGDGDYMMGVQALWTAANQKIPMLIVVANNRAYFNDVIHQERVANIRSRDVSRKWVGQQIDDPAPDLAGMARAQGLVGYGPISDVKELNDVLAQAVAEVQSGASVVVDVVIDPGYAPAMVAGLVRESKGKNENDHN